MRKMIHILLILIIIFFVNFFFYFISDDYRFFLKKLKDNESVIYIEKPIINDDFIIEDNWESDIVKVNIKIDDSWVKTNNIDDSWVKTNKTDTAYKTRIILGEKYKELLYLFSEYNLREIELNTNIFDITNEYPNKYYEYYGDELTLYFFTTKSYNEVKDIFKVLEYELPIKLNELNNFWKHSFYINLNEDIKDNFVRIVLEMNGITVWLKIKEESYHLVKQKLREFNTLDNTIKTEQ